MTQNKIAIINVIIDLIIRFLSELQFKSNDLKEYICKIYLKKVIELQKCHEDERYELKDELKRHETFDLNIIKRQIIDINRLYTEREDFALRMYKIIFKNSTRLDLNISFTVTNVNYKNQEKTYETMLREDQKIDTLREIVKLINHIHYYDY